MLGGENELKSARDCCQVIFCFLRRVSGVIIQHQSDLITLGIFFIQDLQKGNEVRALMRFPYERNSFPGNKVNTCKQGEGSVPNILIIPICCTVSNARRKIRSGWCDCLNTRFLTYD